MERPTTTYRQGPWAYYPSGFESHERAGYIRQNGHTIAAVLHDRGTQFDGMAIVPERDEANARLIEKLIGEIR